MPALILIMLKLRNLFFFNRHLKKIARLTSSAEKNSLECIFPIIVSMYTSVKLYLCNTLGRKNLH